MWRKFRHQPDNDTPFEMWGGGNPLYYSGASYMLYNQSDYDKLLLESCGINSESFTMEASALLEEHNGFGDATLPVHIEIQSPVVMCPIKNRSSSDSGSDNSAHPDVISNHPGAVRTDPSVNLIDSDSYHVPDSDPVFRSPHNLIDIGNSENHYAQNGDGSLV